ncbi:MAG TPA: hypothetical protein VHG28_21665 [Longimicrobiaceae bacterium]|nr:hypothetical protein [Longimicrobiaceae bacterium]
MPKLSGKDLTILVLTIALAGLAWWVAYSRKPGDPGPITQAHQDSLKLARRYDSLGYVTFDLKREIHSRSLHELLQHQERPAPVPGAPPGMIIEPVVPSVPPPTAAEVERLARAVDRATRGRTVVLVVQKDLGTSGVEEWLRTSGFQVQKSLDPTDRPTSALTLGDSVPLPVAKLIALEMLRRGVPLKRIRLAESSRDPMQIRLHGAAHLESTTALTVAQITALSRPAPTQ